MTWGTMSRSFSSTQAAAKSSAMPTMAPPTSAPGMEPKPPSTAPASARRAMWPMLGSMRLTGATSTPAMVDTAAASAQMADSRVLTGMPMK